MKPPVRKISSAVTNQKGVKVPATANDTVSVAADLNYHLPHGMVLWRVGESHPQFRGYICKSVNASGSVWKLGSDVLHLSNCHDKISIAEIVSTATELINDAH